MYLTLLEGLLAFGECLARPWRYHSMLTADCLLEGGCCAAPQPQSNHLGYSMLSPTSCICEAGSNLAEVAVYARMYHCQHQGVCQQLGWHSQRNKPSEGYLLGPAGHQPDASSD